MIKYVAFCLCCFLPFFLLSQAYFLEIQTVDSLSNKPLGFVNIQVESPSFSKGGSTNEAGRWQISLPQGSYRLRASFLGYEDLELTIDLREAKSIRLQLRGQAEQLSTVVVSDIDSRAQLARPLMGVERLSIAQLEALPVALGEVDIFRGLQLLSGVSSAGEASNGLSVRGGTVDQNLVLLDGAPIFTPTHLFGLFSVFTPDAVGSVDLYRANIPARFGGRIASVVDVRSRNPNTEQFKMQGGIGLVSSHLSLESPLSRNKKLQVLAAGRLGFNDFVFGLVEQLKKTRSNFSDATLKLRYQPNDKHIFTFSGFYSKDFYQVDLLNSFGGIIADANQYDYYTLNASVEWLNLLSDKTTWQSRLVSSDHLPKIRFPQQGNDFVIEYSSRTQYRSLQTSLDHRANGGHHLSAGLQLIHYALSPGALDPGGSTAVRAVQLAQENGIELSIFAEDEWEVSDALSLSAGLRFTRFSQLGPGEQRLYSAGDERTDDLLESRTLFPNGKEMQTYQGLEPRLGLSLQINETTSLKAAYALSRQYLQNIYNATTPLPTSRWKLSDNHILPQKADLYSIGLYRLLGENQLFELSLEAYHRNIDNLLEYKAGADFFLQPAIETDVIQGEGRAYGVEVGIYKRKGSLTGQLNYTFARSRNRLAGNNFQTSINGGNWYDGYFDQPHTFNSALTLDDGKTHRVSLNFVVQSNRPYTVPNGFLDVDGLSVPLFLERNNARLPTYHRLDFSWTIHNPSMKKKRWVGEWTFTVYNLYGRKNAYNIYYQARLPGSPSNVFGSSPLGSYQLTIFGAPIASLTYNFKFS